MIRGIILLILSSVVLTLSADYTQQEQCHFCGEPPRPVYEESFDFYPTPTTRGIEYVEPNNCQDLQDFYETVSEPEHGFIKKTSTSLLSGLLREVIGIIEGVVNLVRELLERLHLFRRERGIIDLILRDVLGGIFRVLRGCHHPLHAATIVEQLHGISTRERQLEHDSQYLEQSYAAAQTRQELLNGQKNIYDKCMTVSRNMDTREKKCNSRPGSGSAGLLGGSGGLLGGLVGGLLNPACDRGFLIETVLGLVNTVVDLVRDLLCALKVDIANFDLALKMCLRNLLGINADIWLSVSDLLRWDDDFRNGHIHPVIKHLENHHCVPQHDIYRRYAEIMGDEQTRNHYYHLSELPVRGRGYKFNNCHMTCRNSKGIDISLDINVLGLIFVDIEVDLDLDIFCELDFHVEIDADVNLGQLPVIHNGVGDFLESFRVVTQGLTGCNHVETSVVKINAVTGLVNARVDLLLGLGRRFCNPLLALNLGIDIGDILGGVPGIANRHITECNSYKDVESITYAIQEADNKITEYTPQGSDYNEEIDTLLYETNDIVTSQQKEEEQYQEQYGWDWYESQYNSGNDESEYDTGSQSEYNTGTQSGYDSGSQSEYNTGTQSGYDSGSQSGYDSGSQSEYNTGTQSGYDSGSQSYSPEDVIKQAYDTAQVYTHKTNTSNQECRCALEHYKRALDITEARIHTCRREYLEARRQLLQNPTDTALIEIVAGAEIKFRNYLNELIVLRGVFAQVYADLQLRIGVLDRELLSICLDLRARVSLLEGGLINLCADIRLDLSVNLGLFNEHLTGLLRGLRPTIRAVECLVDDLVGTIGILGLNCRVDDVCHEGESYEQMRHIHHQLLTPGCAMLTKNPYVHVADGSTHKRSATENSCNYKITVRDNAPSKTTTSVDRATEETGMSATKATTSSASSLVFSFLIVFLSVLCFF